MAKTIEHVHWPDAPDVWMPYAPAIKVKGGTTVYLAGVTAAPVYHHHPHRPEEFDSMPRTMEAQARAALENLKRGLTAGGAFLARSWRSPIELRVHPACHPSARDGRFEFLADGGILRVIRDRAAAFAQIDRAVIHELLARKARLARALVVGTVPGRDAQALLA